MDTTSRQLIIDALREQRAKIDDAIAQVEGLGATGRRSRTGPHWTQTPEGKEKLAARFATKKKRGRPRKAATE